MEGATLARLGRVEGGYARPNLLPDETGPQTMSPRMRSDRAGYRG